MLPTWLPTAQVSTNTLNLILDPPQPRAGSHQRYSGQDVEKAIYLGLKCVCKLCLPLQFAYLKMAGSSKDEIPSELKH